MAETTLSPVMELRVAITTGEFERLAGFYRVGLGLEPAQEWPQDQGRALVLDVGKATLEVFDERQAQTVDQIEVGRRISGPVRFALRVPDLDAAMERLLAHGATLVHPPVVTPAGADHPAGDWGESPRSQLAMTMSSNTASTVSRSLKACGTRNPTVHRAGRPAG